MQGLRSQQGLKTLPAQLPSYSEGDARVLWPRLSPFLSPLPATSVYSSRTSELEWSGLPSVARETVAPAREATAGREPVPVCPEVGEELGLRVLVRSLSPPWVTLSSSCLVRGQVGEQLSCVALGTSSSLSTRCLIYMRREGLGQNLPFG